MKDLKALGLKLLIFSLKFGGPEKGRLG